MNTQHNKQLVIKLNNTTMHDEPCAFCGERGEAPIGPAVFVAESNQRVCDACAQERANYTFYRDLCSARRAWERDSYERAVDEYYEERLAQESASQAQAAEPFFAHEFDGLESESGPDGLKIQPAPEAIRLDALIDRVNLLVERGEELLALQGEAAHPSIAGLLFALDEDICDLVLALSHAEPALTILRELTAKLGLRAQSYAEVFGTKQPDGGAGDFVTRVRIPHSVFGKRFARFDPTLDLDLSDSDIPF